MFFKTKLEALFKSWRSTRHAKRSSYTENVPRDRLRSNKESRLLKEQNWSCLVFIPASEVSAAYKQTIVRFLFIFWGASVCWNLLHHRLSLPPHQIHQEGAIVFFSSALKKLLISLKYDIASMNREKMRNKALLIHFSCQHSSGIVFHLEYRASSSFHIFYHTSDFFFFSFLFAHWNTLQLVAQFFFRQGENKLISKQGCENIY